MISQGVHEGTYRFVYSWTTDIEWTSQQLQEFSYSLYIYTQYLFVLLETSVFDIRFKKHVLVNSLHAAFYCYNNKTLLIDMCDCLLFV